jgi:hypothetical protein
MANETPPFFVVGAARSGTTLIRVMLDRHPGVAIPPESHFIPRLFEQRRRYGEGGRIQRANDFLRDLAADGRFRSWELPIESVREQLAAVEGPTFADGIAAAFSAYAKAQGKPRWGDKTPKYVDVIPLLAGLFPEARFVHVIRDGRDVALSVLDMERLHAHAATPARVWARQIKMGRAAGRSLGPTRYLELRYEDLLEDPDARLRELCTFLGVSFEPGMLDHADRALDRIPKRQQGMHKRLALPPTKGLRDWRSQMKASELAEFEAIAGAELEATGYTLATGPPSIATRVRASMRSGGFWGRYLKGRSSVAFRRRRRRKEREREARESVGED